MNIMINDVAEREDHGKIRKEGEEEGKEGGR